MPLAAADQEDGNALPTERAACIRASCGVGCVWLQIGGMCGSQDVKHAVSVVEVAAQGAPWAATGAYVDAVREGRSSLALTGAGDPTGRGRGYSYTRDIRRVGPDPWYPDAC